MADDQTPQKTALLELRDFCKENGLKIGWIAKELGITDQLIRYYLGMERTPPELEKRIRAVLRKHGSKLRTTGATRKRVFR